jgi:hypothetical protein
MKQHIQGGIWTAKYQLVLSLHLQHRYSQSQWTDQSKTEQNEGETRFYNGKDSGVKWYNAHKELAKLYACLKALNTAPAWFQWSMS